jgi:hypothetical protein
MIDLPCSILVLLLLQLQLKPLKQPACLYYIKKNDFTNISEELVASIFTEYKGGQEL